MGKTWAIICRPCLDPEVAEDGPCLRAGLQGAPQLSQIVQMAGQGLSTATHGQSTRRRRRSEGSVVNTTASWASAAWAATMASIPVGIRRAPDRSTLNRSWPARRAVACSVSRVPIRLISWLTGASWGRPVIVSESVTVGMTGSQPCSRRSRSTHRNSWLPVARSITPESSTTVGLLTTMRPTGSWRPAGRHVA